jgi:hypothetical protein
MARRRTSKKRPSKIRKNRLSISYPALLFLLLCAGVLLTMWSFRAVADNIQVSATVPANPVTGPAGITNPSDGQHVSSIPISISGTCPADGSGGYVKVYHNDVFSGVAICDGSNNFSLSSDLFPGANVIKSQIYNITNAAGPASTPITVYYDALQPQPQPPAGSPPGGQNTNTPTLIISSEFSYIGYYVGQTTKWDLTINGGVSPYAINVNWGDDKSTVLSRKDAGTFSVEHKYAASGKQKNHSYTISISASDSSGEQSNLQLFVIINDRSVSPAAAAIVKPTCQSSGFSLGSIGCYVENKNLLKFLWPAYGIVLLMVISYGLGEREEILQLTKKGRLKKRRT